MSSRARFSWSDTLVSHHDRRKPAMDARRFEACEMRASAEHELRRDHAVERLQAVLERGRRAHAPFGAELDLGLAFGVVIADAHGRRATAVRGERVLKP